MIHDIISIPCRSGGVPRIGQDGYYTCVFHAHEWVRPDKAYGYDQLVYVCENYHADIVDFKEYSHRELGIPKYEMCIETLDTIKMRFVYFLRKQKQIAKRILEK